MSTRQSPATIALMYALLAALWIALSDNLMDFAIPDPVLRGQVELLKGLGFVAVTSGLLYLLLRLRAPLPAGKDAGATLGGSRRMMPLLFALALSVPLLALTVYTLHSRQEERDAFADLASMARLKADQIETWLAERRADSSALAASSGFVERVAKFRATGDAHEERAIRNRLESLIRFVGYDAVTVFDPQGRPLLHYGEPFGVPESVRALFAATLASGQVRMSPLLRDAQGRAQLEFIAPLHLPGSEAVGVVVLHVSPARFLYPAIQAWPSASGSGEFLLARQEGESALFLNELRHRKGTALNLREPMNRADLLAVAAIRTAQPGHMRGEDYRGVPVLAAWRPIKGTDWRLVAKVDRAEALEGARTTAVWVGSVTLFSVLLLALTLIALWRTRRRADRIAVQAESDQLFKLFFDLPFVGMAVTSPESKRWARFNNELCTVLGYTREELENLSWAEITHPEDLDKDIAEFECVMRGESEGYVLDKRFIRKDGAIVHATIDVKCRRKPDGKVDFFVATVRDITENRLAQKKIETLLGMYAALSRCNEAIVRCQDEEALFAQICAAATEQGGMKLAWVGMVDERRRVRRVSSSGEGQDYLEGIVISLEEGDPSGQGPTGTSIRENRPCWCQDFAADPRTAAWHERGARYGWGSSAALPLRRNGVAVGSFTLYSERVAYFDEAVQGLLMEMAADISFALDNFDREASRRKAEATLMDQYEELRRWYQAMLGREARALALKREVNTLLLQSGRPPRYASVEDDSPQDRVAEGGAK